MKNLKQKIKQKDPVTQINYVNRNKKLDRNIVSVKFLMHVS